MADSNWQDAVYLSSNSLFFIGDVINFGSGAGAKTIVFSNAAGGLSFVGNPSANRTISLQDVNGTVGLVSAFSAGTTNIINSGMSFADGGGVTWGINGNTITATVNAGGGGVAISAAGSSASSGTVVFSNSNNVSFAMNGSTVTAIAEPDMAFVMCLLGV